MDLSSTDFIDTESKSDSGDLSWENRGKLIVSARDFLVSAVNLMPKNRGLIHIKDTTNVVLMHQTSQLPEDTYLLNTGVIYLEENTVFQVGWGANFRDPASFKQILNAHELVNDDDCVNDILPNLGDGAASEFQAVYDLKTNKGITRWLTFGEEGLVQRHLTVYEAGSLGELNPEHESTDANSEFTAIYIPTAI
jgi:hypothetical protein